MEYSEVSDLLTRIHGCTFASLDAETKARGVRRVVTNERVLLFTNKNSSGYENMVRKRLKEAGLDPDSFNVGPLPWGQRVPNTPMIFHNETMYLQTILLAAGNEGFYIGDVPVDPKDFNLKPSTVRMAGRKVVVNTYKLESIQRIKLLKEERFSSGD